MAARKNTTCLLHSLLACGILLPWKAALAGDPLLDSLNICAALDADRQRLACFDALVEEQAQNKRGRNLSDRPTLDELGAENLQDSESKTEEEEVTVAARVVRCERDASRKKYLFHLQGNQIWKQVSDKRLFYKNCDFDVLITRDFFGYKMQVIGEKSKIRITRIR